MLRVSEKCYGPVSHDRTPCSRSTVPSFCVTLKLLSICHAFLLRTSAMALLPTYPHACHGQVNRARTSVLLRHVLCSRKCLTCNRSERHTEATSRNEKLTRLQQGRKTTRVVSREIGMPQLDALFGHSHESHQYINMCLTFSCEMLNIVWRSCMEMTQNMCGIIGQRSRKQPQTHCLL